MKEDVEKLTEIERALLSDRFADFERAVLQDNIVLCDTKAGLLLAFTGAMVIFCIDAFVKLEVGAGAHSWIGPVVRGLLLLGALGFLASAQCSLTTIMPRIRRGGVTDHIFWESPVFSQPVEGYIEAIMNLDPAVELEEKLRHLYLLAGICRRKFGHFQLAMHLGQGAFACVVVGELLRAFG